MADENAVTAIYDNHQNAESAVKQIEKDSFDMKRLSIVAKGYRTKGQVIGYFNASDRIFLVPGIGPVLVGGPLVASIVGVLEGATVIGGLSALGAGLVSLGIPEDSVAHYEAALKADKSLVVALGTADEVAKVRGTLEAAGAAEAETYTDRGSGPTPP
jgi:hypothetical protein